MRVAITGTFILDVTDWYDGERLTKKETLEKLNEDFNDIEIFMNHCNPSIEGNVEVKELFL